jgi:hypothetical protein
MRVVERLPWYLGGAFAISLGVVAVAHTPWGRPLLGWVAPACPIDLARLTPQGIEQARVAAVQRRRGDDRERMRPALDFELGQSTRAQVEAELSRRGGSCRSERADTALRCSFTDAQIDDLFAQFSDGRLVALELVRSAVDGVRALDWLDQLERHLSASVGAVTARFGTRDATELDTRFAQSIVEYRYANYVAQISALNTGRAIKLREQYQTF